MWQYEKKLQYPVKIANPNPALATVIISQLGGADFKKLYTKEREVVQTTSRFFLVLAFSHWNTIITLSNYAILTIISC